MFTGPSSRNLINLAFDKNVCVHYNKYQYNSTQVNTVDFGIEWYLI